MTEYVLCFAHDKNAAKARVLLVRKAKPAWQAGLFNLPGGKIEEGEQPFEAAIRELREETGIRAIAHRCRVMGIITGPGYRVYAVYCPFENQSLVTAEEEKPFWLSLKDALRSKYLIPNLKIVIPFMLAQLDGWSIAGGLNEGVETDWTVGVHAST